MLISEERLFEVLAETVEWYKNNKRALNDTHDCVYYNHLDGSMCAIGRCLKEPKVVDGIFVGDSTVVDLIELRTDNVFKEEYRHIPIGFWKELQRLHDYDNNWNKTAKGQNLSDLGERRLTDFKKRIAGWYQ